MLVPRKMVTTFDTIIIGAGMSGLACAAKLAESPFYGETSVNGGKALAVLEARDRVGGRIGSVIVNGNRLDTGANWIHGIGSKDSPLGVNPLVEILPKKHFRELSCSVSFKPAHVNGMSGKRDIDSETSGSDSENSSSIADQSTTPDKSWVKVNPQSLSSEKHGHEKDLVIPPKMSHKLFNTLWTLIEALHERSEETASEEAKHTSMLQAIKEDEDFRAAFDTLPKDYHEVLRALPQFIENMEAAPLCASSAANAYGYTGMGLLEYAIEDFDGDQVFLHDGYTAVVTEVGKQVIKHGEVKLETEVKNINWDGDLIEISTNHGVYAAKKVVCTFPLGVLQHDLASSVKPQPTIFAPGLPNHKAEAIRSLGFGTLDKIFLVYDKPWWTESPWIDILKPGFTFQPFPKDPDSDEAEESSEEPNEPDSFWGFTDELPGIEIDSDGQMSQGIRALSLINLHALTGYPVLSCFVYCANALHIEGLSDHAASAIVHRSISKWLGREPPMPDAVHVTRWAQDEYARGSYSHMIAGVSETSHRAVIAEPLVNEHGAELRFAGEHTSHNHFATVHGALLSGWREAEAILKSESGK